MILIPRQYLQNGTVPAAKKKNNPSNGIILFRSIIPVQSSITPINASIIGITWE